MSLIGDILGTGAKGLLDGIGGIIDGVTTTDEEKAAANLKVQQLIAAKDAEIEQTIRRTVEAKERILVAELNQSDGYTKRARPSIVYTGLVLALGAATARLLGTEIDVDTLVPSEFWYAWAGVTGTWVVGRTMEKRGSTNGLVKKVTGTEW
jgi:hypothetical protein